jgi:hypothetical protein
MEPHESIPFYINEEKCQYIAQKVLNSWDLGGPNDDEKIVTVLSKREKSVCMSRTLGLQSIITDTRIDDIIEHMDEMSWWWDNYDLYQGVLYCIGEISNYIAEGSPSFWENYGWYLLLVLYIFVNFYRAQPRLQRLSSSDIQERINYRELNEEEQTEATSLMNKYQCYSCPICLEDFTNAVNATENGTESYTEENKFIGSDNVQIHLLRCGHSTCQRCWDEWITVGKNLRLCPVCKRDIGG